MLKQLNNSFSSWKYLKESFVDNLVPILAVVGIGYWITNTLNESFWRVVLVSTVSVVVFGAYYYFVVFNKEQRASVVDAVKTKLHLK